MPVIPQLHELVASTKHIINPIPHPTKFTLDSSGVAGFFGGDGAVTGMATVNLYDYRRWGGWYNTPGSYDIAKQYGRLASSRFWNGLFPGGTHDPAELFGLDGRTGPPFIAARSGSNFAHTGHLAYLLARKAREIKPITVDGGGHKTNPASVTIIDLRFEPEAIVHPQLLRSHSGLFAVVPIAVSIAACVLCALHAEWYGFASILVGMIAHGLACFVLGTGRLAFKHPNPAAGAPPGDGILRDDTGVIVLRGTESVINSFTRGRFLLDFSLKLRKPASNQSDGPTNADGQANGEASRQSYGRGTKQDAGQDVGQDVERDAGREVGQDAERGADEQPEKTSLQLQEQPNQYLIGIPSLLLTLQFLVQLLLIPQADLFGQLMFIMTLIASWAYNAYLSSLDREDIQTKILLNNVLKLPKTPFQKYEFSSWTSMTVFACLALEPKVGEPHDNAARLLSELIPNHTAVWEEWRKVIARRISNRTNSWDVPSAEQMKDSKLGDRKLLTALFKDAKVAYQMWCKVKPAADRSNRESSVSLTEAGNHV